ncbi:MAG: hypothetical protein V4736_07615 [Bdellovibrionota bacterium]
MKDHKKIRRALEHVGDVEIPMDPKFYARLHNQIMSRIEDVEMEPPPLWLRSKKYLQSHWKSWFLVQHRDNSSRRNSSLDN